MYRNNKRQREDDGFIKMKKLAFILHAMTKRDENSLNDQIQGVQKAASEIKVYPKQANQCVKMIFVGGITMPHRAPQIANLLCLLDREPGFGIEISELIEKTWVEVLLNGDAHEIINMIWLYMHMSAVGLINKEDFENMLTEIVGRLNGDNILQNDFYASVLEFVLPVYKKYNSGFSINLSDTLKEFYSSRKRKENELFKVLEDLKPYKGSDETTSVGITKIDVRREAFQASLKNEIFNKLTLVEDFKLSREVSERRVSLALNHLSGLKIRDSESFTYTGFVTRIFDQTCLKMDYFKNAPPRKFVLPDISDPIYWYFKRFLTDCSQIMHGSLWEGSVQTLSIQCAFKDSTFALVDNISEILTSVKKNEISHESPFVACHLITEIFAAKLIDPVSSVHWTFISNMYIRYCTEMSAFFPQAIGRFIHATFNRIAFIDIATVFKFSNFFSLFLSNYEMNWAFQSWVPTLVDKQNLKHIIFVKATFEKCSELLTYDKVNAKIPEEISNLVGPGLKINNLYISNENEDIKSYASGIASQLQKKEIKKESNPFATIEGEEKVDNDLKLKIEFISLLENSNASTTHTFAIIEKYDDFFKTIDAQDLILWTWEAWRNSTTRFYRLLQKYVELRLVQPDDIIKWFVLEVGNGLDENNWLPVLLVFKFLEDQVTGLNENSFSYELVTQASKIQKITPILKSFVLAVDFY
eukprot:NODE_50_length_31184_cov_0.705099.p3 type:complete len:699 gc:universal NODE_50_length_31184_cov_0.705099:13492-15588(+)